MTLHSSTLLFQSAHGELRTTRFIRLGFCFLASYCFGGLAVLAQPDQSLPACNALVEKIQASISTLKKVRTIDEQAKIFQMLEGLGLRGVPHLIDNMDDRTPLRFRAISLVNKSTNSFEAARHYGPEQTVDAIAALLNQLTGENFGYIQNGAADGERSQSVTGWRNWKERQFRINPDGCYEKRNAEPNQTTGR